MWVFLSDSFLSIVKHKQDDKILVVRARRSGDIEKVFPSAKVFTLPGRDYQFRAEIDRSDVAEAMYRQVAGLEHTNFKDSVRDHDYHEACSRVWTIMSKLQPVPPYSTARNVRAPARGQRRLGFPNE